MLRRRIIPCLDVKDGHVVKGVQFRDHQVLGDILELARFYAEQGADELVFYDITASAEKRAVDPTWVDKIARFLDIPFCVAGGIRSVADARRVLNAGADKISINSPALENPQLISDLAAAFGSQCVVVGIDSHRESDGGQYVYMYTGSEKTSTRTSKPTEAWVKEVQELGAGEIVLNCMNQDGVGKGYDLSQLKAVRKICRIPLIASGGAGHVDHFRDVFQQAGVDGALAAGVFHRRSILIGDLKQYLQSAGIRIRLPEKRDPVSPVTSSLNKPSIDWEKVGSLVPTIVQDAKDRSVLMHGWMNPEALDVTLQSGFVTFYSRSKGRLWTKGESSGNRLRALEIRTDCDKDTVLVIAEPQGPTCHTGDHSCFGSTANLGISFLSHLESIIDHRSRERLPSQSYTATLFSKGTDRIAQKVGEEAVEVVIASKNSDAGKLAEESADLLFHLIVLLKNRGLSLGDVLKVLEKRHASANPSKNTV